MGFYESYERFTEVAEILVGAYVPRLRELRPTDHSEMWLYGDRLSAPGRIDGINRRLAEANTAAFGDPEASPAK